MPKIEEIGKLSFDREQIIGEGGFGKVYEGLFEDVKRVAVKRFQKSGKVDGPSIKLEAELMLKANEHPNILRYFCYEVDDDFV